MVVVRFLLVLWGLCVATKNGGENYVETSLELYGSNKCMQATAALGKEMSFLGIICFFVYR